MEFVNNKIQCTLPMRSGLGQISPKNAATSCHLRTLQVTRTCDYALRASDRCSFRLRYLVIATIAWQGDREETVTYSARARRVNRRALMIALVAAPSARISEPPRPMKGPTYSFGMRHLQILAPAGPYFSVVGRAAEHGTQQVRNRITQKLTYSYTGRPTSGLSNASLHASSMTAQGMRRQQRYSTNNPRRWRFILIISVFFVLP